METQKNERDAGAFLEDRAREDMCRLKSLDTRGSTQWTGMGTDFTHYEFRGTGLAEEVEHRIECPRSLTLAQRFQRVCEEVSRRYRGCPQKETPKTVNIYVDLKG